METRALRPLVGRTVEFVAAADVGRGVLLSVTKRSAWLVVGDVDVVVPAEELRYLREAAP